MRVDRADERHVGGVEPDDAMIALVDVAVPAHRRSEDQVALLHLAAASVDDGGGAVGAGGEADRRAGVTVRAGAVARLQHREGGEHGAGGGGFRAEGRMRHDQRAPLDVVDRHLADRAVQERLDVAPAPEERRIARLRLDRGDSLVAVPERMQVVRLELGDEGSACACAVIATSAMACLLLALASAVMPASSGHPVTRPHFAAGSRTCRWLLDRPRTRAMTHELGKTCHVLGSLASMFVESMMTCLMKTRGSTLSPLR